MQIYANIPWYCFAFGAQQEIDILIGQVNFGEAFIIAHSLGYYEFVIVENLPKLVWNFAVHIANGPAADFHDISEFIQSCINRFLHACIVQDRFWFDRNGNVQIVLLDFGQKQFVEYYLTGVVN